MFSKNILTLGVLAMLVISVLGFSRAAGNVGARKGGQMFMSAVSDATQKKISGNDVMVFSKSYCPFCDRAKAALEGKGIAFQVEELDKLGAEGAEIQAALAEMTGQRTVPNVFVKGKHLGGCDDVLASLGSGKFQELLK